MTQPITPIARDLPQSGGARPRQDPEAHLRHLAVKLEASFLSEMLRHAKLGETEGPFSGGTGAAQFASFLREAQATEIARSGGIGLADVIFNALLQDQKER